MSVVLWHIEVSHYNEKARWALDYKRIPHERRVPMPGLHPLHAFRLTGGRHHTLPVLELDGRRIGDSTAIIAALEDHRPEPPLYPADPVERARALELEDFFDEQLAPALRAYVWSQTLDDPDQVVGAVTRTDRGVRARALRTLLPVLRPLMRRKYGAGREEAVGARAAVVAAMDRLEAELQPSGYLVGDDFSVADLTAAALFTPVLSPPGRQYAPPTLVAPVLELRAELAAREGGRWVEEMYARHRGASAAVAA